MISRYNLYDNPGGAMKETWSFPLRAGPSQTILAILWLFWYLWHSPLSNFKKQTQDTFQRLWSYIYWSPFSELQSVWKLKWKHEILLIIKRSLHQQKITCQKPPLKALTWYLYQCLRKNNWYLLDEWLVNQLMN